MCGRFTLRTPMTVLIKHFGIDVSPDQLDLEFNPRYNIPPSVEVPIIRLTEDKRRLSMVRWGLLPPWTKDLKSAPMLNNARAETVTEKPSFRTAFKKRRCLIPVDGFYEWTPVGKARQPYDFRRPGEQPFAFAGLWDTWKKDELEIESCTIITTDANEVIAPVHHRMPVVLSTNDYNNWLDPSVTELTKLLTPCPDDELICYPVDPVVNNARNQ